MSKKKRYYGYTGSVPENLSIKKIEKNIKIFDGHYEKEYRYIIIDEDTGKTFDDAQGWGYKTYQKAQAALNYKKRDKKSFDKMYDIKDAVRKWCKENKSVMRYIEGCMFDSLKDRTPWTEKNLEDALKNNDIDIEKLPFSIKDLNKYM